MLNFVVYFMAFISNHKSHHNSATPTAPLHFGAHMDVIFELQYLSKYNEPLTSIMNDTLEELSKRISSLIPGDVKHMQEDIESNVRSLLQNSLTKMNLVTREEFDVQTAVLQRTREKLEQLEKQIEQLK